MKICMLGDFSLCRGDGAVLRASDSTSRRVWALLQYVTAFRQRPVSQQEMIDALWGRSETENPAGTLKTLLHRARALLQSLGFADAKQVLLYRRGFISLNPELEITVDAEEFDRLCTLSGAVETDAELESALRALALYTGDFLPGADENTWVISLRAHYHTRYLRLSCAAAGALGRRGEFERAVGLCRTAAVLDPYDEPVHMRLMQLLAACGRQQEAIAHYTELSSRLMDELGVVPSEQMTALYRELSRSSEGVERDLNIVRGALSEKNPDEGAFFCEYAVFREIYRLEARSAARSGQAVQLAMLTLLADGAGALPQRRRTAVMNTLRRAIQTSLRSGDVFTRFSAVQYLILLPSASYENSVRVVGRILQAFHAQPGLGAVCEYSLLPVLPALHGEPGPAFFSAPACERKKDRP